MDDCFQEQFRGSRTRTPGASPTCRSCGCGEHACSPEGFCTGCKLTYKQARLAREQELRDTAGLPAAANPEWQNTFADALPGQYELMLAHAAAHHLQHGGPANEGMSVEALHDYLGDTMDRVRGLCEQETK